MLVAVLQGLDGETSILRMTVRNLFDSIMHWFVLYNDSNYSGLKLRMRTKNSFLISQPKLML